MNVIIEGLYRVFSSSFTYNLIAVLSLFVSTFVAHRTFLKRFQGKVWPVNSVVLMYVDDVPAIGLGCFIENTSSKAGRLDDVRLIVRHAGTASTYYFYPHLLRNDYNTYADYEDKDWFPFAGILLMPNDKLEKFIVFKPLNDRFSANAGSYQITLEVRWNVAKKWQSAMPMFIILDEAAQIHWNSPQAAALQVWSQQFLNQRALG